jgi:hypothetical protein
MANLQLTVPQFAALCTGKSSPPWTLKIQPGQSAKSVSLKSLIAQVSDTEVLIFLELRNGTIFENYPGAISNYVQAYIWNRTALSDDDLSKLATVLTQNNLSLVYVSSTMQTVGISGTFGNFNAMRFFGLGQITSVGNTLTSSVSTGEAGQSQSTTFWSDGQAVGQGAAGVASYGYGAWLVRPVLSGARIVWSALENAAGQYAATAAADATAASELELAALGGAEAYVPAVAIVTGAEVVLGCVAMGLGLGLLVVATGALWAAYEASQPPPNPFRTPLNSPGTDTPTDIAPQNVPQGVPVIQPVNTTPPTVGPQPADLSNELISSTPYTAESIASGDLLLGGVNPNAPTFPSTYSALSANRGQAYLSNPWQQMPLPANLPLGTGPALVSTQQPTQSNGNTGDVFYKVQVTNPANGQVITISGPENVGLNSSTVLISDSLADKTLSTTTRMTVDSNTQVAQFDVTQSTGDYAPNSWPPELNAGGGGPIYGGTGSPTGTGTGEIGTGTGGVGTNGTNGTDGTDGTDGADGADGADLGGTGTGGGLPSG